MATPKKNDLDKALEEGLDAGRKAGGNEEYERKQAELKAVEAKKAERDEKRAAAFNTASGVLKAFKDLATKPGSTFGFDSYNITDGYDLKKLSGKYGDTAVNLKDTDLVIITNVPQSAFGAFRESGYDNLETRIHKVAVLATDAGDVIALGDVYKKDQGGVEFVRGTKDDSAEVVKFVAKKAAQAGFVR